MRHVFKNTAEFIDKTIIFECKTCISAADKTIHQKYDAL